jgi:hypothetical protein
MAGWAGGADDALHGVRDCMPLRENAMGPFPHHLPDAMRRARAFMALGAALCVIVLVGLVALHAPVHGAVDEPAVPRVASDLPPAAVQARDFLHAPVTAGNVPTAEAAFQSGAPAPEEPPPTF